MSDESIWKEIEAHRAIPRGGWQLLAHLTASIVSSTVLLFMGYLALNATGTIAIGVLAWTVMVLASTVIWWQFMLSPERRQWLRAYWRKNVRGYAVCWVVNVDGSTTSYPVYPRGKDPNPDGIGFFLPLGGWFAMSCVAWLGLASGWRVAWGSRTYQDNLEVCITDGSGMRMCMPITDALAILAEYRALKPLQLDGMDMSFTWEDILFTARKQRDDTRRDWDETRRQIEEARAALATTIRERDAEQATHQRTREQGDITERQLNLDRQLIADQRDAAQREAQEYRGRAVCAESQREITRNLYDETLAFLEGLVEQFEESGRCRTHLESLRIQREVLTCLRHHSADPSPEFQHYTYALAVIARKIGDLEGRDRKRHARRKQREASETA